MTSLHKSSPSSTSENHGIDYTQYGKYIVNDSVEFRFPNNIVTLKRVSKDKFLYNRKSHDILIEKLLSIRTPDLEIEVVPTLPLYVPSYKTDYMFLRLSKSIFVSRNSSTEIFVSVPIEIGLFFTGNEIREYFDVFACEPRGSKYALYGQPDNGNLCKFATVTPNAVEKDALYYLEGQLKIIIDNEFDTGISLGRIVFPISDHEVYYNQSAASYDDLRIEIKERLGVEIVEVIQQDDTGPNGWHKSPRTMKKTDFKFLMEKGFD
ncbi:MAG: DUF432 domain-containing protein [Nitrosotalea sp.]